VAFSWTKQGILYAACQVARSPLAQLVCRGVLCRNSRRRRERAVRLGGDDAAFVNEFIEKRVQAGESDADIQQDLTDQLCLVRIDRPNPALQARLQNKAVRQTGAAPETDTAVVAMASQSSSVTSYAPTISWDSQAGKYYAISKWKWVNNGFSSDTGFPLNTDRPIGGADSFGTAFNTSLLLTGYSLTVFGDSPYASSAVIGTAADASPTGAGYTFQEHGQYRQTTSTACTYRLNVRSGQEVISFKKSGKCKTVYGFSKYTHTWSSTRVMGMSIGVYSIGISTNTSSNLWNSQSQPGGTATVC
jgi:hypothetical protein